MKIIIVGNGKVGYAIANSLAQEDHDIIMVDASTSALRKAESTWTCCAWRATAPASVC